MNYSSYLSEDTFAVYLFHGVIPRHRHEVRNYTKKHIEASDFRSIIEELCGAGSPVSMSQIVKATETGKKLPPRAFAITFDDGFENNYSVAVPILKEYSVPAAFYITTKFVMENETSWIDRIEHAFEMSDDVELDIEKHAFFGGARSKEEKIELLNEIRKFVKSKCDIDPYEFAKEVCSELGMTKLELDDDLDRMMSWEQIAELHGDQSFTIGGHGHTHRIMSYLNSAELNDEISLSLSILEDRLGAEIYHYSYPEGLAHCYSSEVIDNLKGSGIVCSPTAEQGVNRIGDDLFRLKRIMVT